MKHRGQKSYYDKHNLSRHASKRNSKVKRFFRGFSRWILLIFVAIIFGYAFVTFCFQTVTVVGPSMNPTFSDSQVVLINKMIYNFSDVKRYDVIAYSRVNEDGYFDAPFGMTIQISGVAEEPVTLGDNEYFVMGDNVNNSEDSRYTNVGNIAKTEITGKVVRILLPSSDKGKVK